MSAILAFTVTWRLDSKKVDFKINKIKGNLDPDYSF